MYLNLFNCLEYNKTIDDLPLQYEGLAGMVYIALVMYFVNTHGQLCKSDEDTYIPLTTEEIASILPLKSLDAKTLDFFLKVFVKNNLLYFNSFGILTITGLKYSGDPKEPILHLNNNPSKQYCPFSLDANLSKQQAYKIREEHKKKMLSLANGLGKNDTALIETSDKTSESEMPDDACLMIDVITDFKDAKIAVKSSLYYAMNKLGIKPVKLSGKKSYIFKSEVIKLIEYFANNSNENDVLAQFKNKYSDGCSDTCSDTCSDGNRTVTDNVENTDKQRVLDVSDGNRTVIGRYSDGNRTVNKNIRTKDIDDDIYTTRVRTHEETNTSSKPKYKIEDLYKVGFPDVVNPDKAELAFLKKLVKEYSYELVLYALKRSRVYNGDSVAYVQTIIKGIVSEIPVDKFTLDQAIEPVPMNYEVFQSMYIVRFGYWFNTLDDNNLVTEKFKQAVEKATNYYSMDEIGLALRSVIFDWENGSNKPLEELLDYHLGHSHYSPVREKFISYEGNKVVVDK